MNSGDTEQHTGIRLSWAPSPEERGPCSAAASPGDRDSPELQDTEGTHTHTPSSLQGCQSSSDQQWVTVLGPPIFHAQKRRPVLKTCHLMEMPCTRQGWWRAFLKTHNRTLSSTDTMNDLLSCQKMNVVQSFSVSFFPFLLFTAKELVNTSIPHCCSVPQHARVVPKLNTVLRKKQLQENTI